MTSQPAATTSPFSGNAFNTVPVVPIVPIANPFAIVNPFANAPTTAFSANPFVKSLLPTVQTTPTAFPPRAIDIAPLSNNSGTDDTASRQTRFADAGDVSAIYHQERDEREKERARLIKAGVIDDPEVKKSLEQAITFVGTCTEMCPRFECIQRQHQRMVDRLELTNGKPDHHLFVKSFHRPAAGMENPLPQDVRTPGALVKTLQYLVYGILGNNPWQECHAFVRDRTRSIRQDFTFQNYEGDELVQCTEIIARFHILALYKMIGHPDHAEFMECEQLDKCLTTLGFLYRDGKKKGKVFPNESEFRAYMILRHFRDLYVEQQLVLREWPEEVWESSQVKHALRIYTAVQRYDRPAEDGLHAQHYFNTFFELANAPETDVFTGCLLQICFAEARKFALKIMTENYMKTSKMTTVQFIKDSLRYEAVEQVVEDLQHYGLTVAEHTVDGVSYLHLVTGKNLFNGEQYDRGILPSCGLSFIGENNPTRTRAHPSLMQPKEAAVGRSGKTLSDLIWGTGKQIYHRGKSESPFLHEASYALDRNSVNERNLQSRAADFFNFPEAGMGESDEHDDEEDSVEYPDAPVSAPVSASASTFAAKEAPAFAPVPTPTIASAFAGQNAPNPFAINPFAGTSANPFANNSFVASANKLPETKPAGPKAPESRPVTLFDKRLLESKLDGNPYADVPPLPVTKLPESKPFSFMPSVLDSKLPEFKPAESKPFSFAPSFLDSNATSKLPDFKAPGSQPFSRFGSVSVGTSPASEAPKNGDVGALPPATEAPRSMSDTITPAAQTPPRSPPKSDALRSLFDRITPPVQAPVVSKCVQDDNPLFLPAPRFGSSHGLSQPVSPVKKDPVPPVTADPPPPAVRGPPPIEDPKPTAEMEAKAEAFNKRRIIVPVFYDYLEKAKRKLRRTERRLRKEREMHRAAFVKDPQWWPIAKGSEWYHESVYISVTVWFNNF